MDIIYYGWILYIMCKGGTTIGNLWIVDVRASPSTFLAPSLRCTAGWMSGCGRESQHGGALSCELKFRCVEVVDAIWRYVPIYLEYLPWDDF